MENQTTNLTIGDAASMLIGAGLTQLSDITIALTLIGVGVALKILVAFLQKKGIDVKSEPNMG